MIDFRPIERQIAWRYLRHRRSEGFLSVITWFSIIGITLGVATLILVTSLMNGIRAEIESRFIGVDGHITVYADSPYIKDYQLLVDKLNEKEGVVSALPKVEGQVMVSSRRQALGAQVLGLRAEDLQYKRVIAESISAGNLNAWKAGEGIMLGQRLAQNLRVNVGESVTLISPQGRATIAGLVPRIKSYPVVATLKLGMHAIDSSLIVMPFGLAQTYFKHVRSDTLGGNTASAIEVNISDMQHAIDKAASLQAELGGQYRVYDWQRSNISVFQALTIQRNVMVIILLLIVLVAAFNIISSLIMLVNDKSSAIAVLRTLGMTRRGVMRIFMFAGVLIGAIGTAFGIMLGLLLATHLEDVRQWIEKASGQEILVEQIYFLSSLPTKINPIEVLVIAGFAIGLSFFATIYPARRAASLDPVEVLRGK